MLPWSYFPKFNLVRNKKYDLYCYMLMSNVVGCIVNKKYVFIW
jgi:hypothetical protein